MASHPRRSEYDRVSRRSAEDGTPGDDDEVAVFGSEYRDHPDPAPEVSGGGGQETNVDGEEDDENVGPEEIGAGNGHVDKDDIEYIGEAEGSDDEDDEEEEEDEYESFQDVRDRLNGGGSGSGSDLHHRAHADDASADGTLHDVDVNLDPTEAIMDRAYRAYQRRRALFLLAATVLVAAAVGTVLAVSLTRRGGRGGGKNAPPSLSSLVSGGSGGSGSAPSVGGGSAAGGGDDGNDALIPPPPDLADLCGPKKMRGQSRRQCREACRPSECCYLPSIQSLSCLDGNEGRCKTYEDACSALDGVGVEVTIPGPPEDLGQRCSESSLATDEGKDKCRDSCNAAICCEEPVGACVPSNPDVCDRYAAPCSKLYGEPDVDRFKHGSLFLPEPPANLADKCSPSAIADPKGYEECNRYCKMSMCCSEPIEACRVLNPGMCDKYMGPCATLYGETIEEFRRSVTVPPAPSNLADLCSKDSISTAAGFQKCEEKCDLSRCCTLPIEMCKVINPDSCTDYDGPCSILYTADKDKYKGDVQIPEPPEGMDVSQVCGKDSIGTVLGFTTCEDVCDRARCCDEKIEYCKVTNPKVCNSYDACGEYLSLQFSGTVSAFDAKDQGGLLSLAQQVVKACSYRSLHDLQGLSQCRHICNDRFCCFDKDKKRNCAGEYQCSVFAACQNLLDWDSEHGGGRF